VTYSATAAAVTASGDKCYALPYLTLPYFTYLLTKRSVMCDRRMYGGASSLQQLHSEQPQFRQVSNRDFWQ